MYGCFDRITGLCDRSMAFLIKVKTSFDLVKHSLIFSAKCRSQVSQELRFVFCRWICASQNGGLFIYAYCES